MIEALVVIGITMIMSGVLLAYNQSSKSQLALNVSQAKLVGALSRAKAFSLEKYAGAAAGTPACAFGVHFDAVSAPARAVIFRDMPSSGDRCFDEFGASTFSREYESGEEVEQIAFDASVTVDRNASPGDVVFEAPYLVVYIDGVSSTVPVPVTLRSIDGPGSVSVLVGPGGDITAQ